MVEDYLTDRDQEEALRNWWRENWKWILAGVALGLGLLAAYQYWQTYQTQRAGAAAKVYADFQKALAGNDLEQAGRLLNDLAGDHSKSAYTQQGRLLLAKRDADAGRFDEASKQLRQVVDTSSDEELASIARLRLARLLIQTGKPDEASATARSSRRPAPLLRRCARFAATLWSRRAMRRARGRNTPRRLPKSPRARSIAPQSS